MVTVCVCGRRIRTCGASSGQNAALAALRRREPTGPGVEGVHAAECWHRLSSARTVGPRAGAVPFEDTELVGRLQLFEPQKWSSQRPLGL